MTIIIIIRIIIRIIVITTIVLISVYRGFKEEQGEGPIKPKWILQKVRVGPKRWDAQ